MEAANGGYVEVGELLLENGADPNTSPVPSSRYGSALADYGIIGPQGLCADDRRGQGPR